jgi:hypothetical protein
MAGLEPLSVATFNTLLSKSEGRDKLARLIQYLARTIIGFAGMTTIKKGTALFELNEQATNIMKQLAGARRTHRWCKEFPVIKSVVQTFPRQICAPVDWDAALERGLDLLQKCSLATFLVIDHVGWLKQVKVLGGGKRAGTGTIQLGLKFFCLSNFLGALFQMKKIKDAAAKARESGESCSGEQSKCAQNAFKHALLVLQTAHLSRLRETHDAIVGAAGVVTSAMDVLSQWPEKKAPAKAISDAKPSADAKAKPLQPRSGAC